jgi:hypothetical protein
MKFWWLVDGARVAMEREAVDRIAKGGTWFRLDKWCFYYARLTAVGVIIAHDQEYPVRLIYPDQFPEVPAWVEPRDKIRWSTHQYGDGPLCLDLRPDNWTASATGADLLTAAYELVSAEHAPKPEAVQSAHRIGDLQSYDWTQHPILIGEGCRKRIIENLSSEVKALRWLAAENLWPILINDKSDREAQHGVPTADFSSWRVYTPIYLSYKLAPATTDRQAVLDAARFSPEILAELMETKAALLLFVDASDIVVFHLQPEGRTDRRRYYTLPEEGGIRSGANDALPTKRVAIIGVGSVGSKIAESLVRAGVRNIALVDGDVLLPGNLERHALDWREIGIRKVSGVERRLRNIAPGASVITVAVNLNWQRSARTHAQQIDVIAGCDVIVDATGDDATALFLGAIANANRRSFVSAQVFEGGIGGLIARCNPERDPPFAIGRGSFIAWCNEQEVALPRSGVRDYEALAEDGMPLFADDSSVTATAGHAARVVLDVLNSTPESDDSTWLLLGYANSWLFKGHGHNIRVDVGLKQEAVESRDDAGTDAFIKQLLEDYKIEDSPPEKPSRQADGGPETSRQE